MANKNPFGNISIYGPGNRNTGMGKSMGVDKSGAKTSSSRGPAKSIMIKHQEPMRTAKAPSFSDFKVLFNRENPVKKGMKPHPDALIADQYKRKYNVEPAKKGYKKPDSGRPLPPRRP